jgi:hypothetical protein
MQKFRLEVQRFLALTRNTGTRRLYNLLVAITPSGLHSVVMHQVVPNTSHTIRRGPRPVFTRRLVVNVRPDQQAALADLATAMDVSVSDLVRWIIDHGIDAFTTAWKETHGNT